RADGYEADDVMATLAREAAAEGRPVYIVSSDKDLLQLVEEPVQVLRPEQSGFRELHRNEVVEDWGVYPEQIRDYLALVGDSSDNVPGVKGIGAKTAAKLLGQFGSLQAIYDGLDQISSKSRREKLENGRENAMLSYELVTLENQVPLPVGPGDLELPKLDYAAAVPYFLEQGMRSVVEELGFNASAQAKAIAEPRKEVGEFDFGPDAVDPGTGAPASEETAAGTNTTTPYTPAVTTNLERGSYALVTELAELQEWVERARAAGLYALDTETDSLDPVSARPLGISLAVEPGEGCYIPLHGPDGSVMAEDEVREALRPLVADSVARMVAQNGKYDYKVLSNWGLRPANLHFDTMIAAWLLDTTSSSYGMDKLAEEHLGYRPISYKELFPEAKRGEALPSFAEVPLEQAAEYAAEDADITLRLYHAFAPQLAERRFEKLFYEVEMPLVPLLAEMELRGILLRTDVLASYSEDLTERLAALEQEIYELVGREFNIASTKQLQQILFDERKLQPIRKTKTGYSTDVSVLQVLAKEDPVPDRVLQHRNLSKLKSTYVDALPKLVNERTKRLHTNFGQTGTATGRLSSRDPNLQNIPIRDEEGRRIRSAFVPGEGHRFVSADYAQIELVVLAHLSQDPGLLKAFREQKDVHRETGSMVFGIPSDEVSSEQRRIAKTINFGVMYGMSAFRLARDLEIPRADADAFMEAYFATYSGIKSFIDKTVAEAEENGYVRTLLGRERPLPDIRSKNRNVKQGAERIAVNTPIQGTAADIVKLAMLRIDRRLRAERRAGRLLLQVHDELILEVPEEEVDVVSALVEEEMTKAVEFSVPLRVAVEVGESWGDFHA
ncbi:MAG: DNA polymerase I, partial [Spirochaetes bacterium]|nr:DNA polymerase I [Spirochaetota bacterium]